MKAFLSRLHDRLKGYRTVIVAVVLPAVLALADYLPGVNWLGLGISPQTAAILSVIFTGLRLVTRSAFGEKPNG